MGIEKITSGLKKLRNISITEFHKKVKMTLLAVLDVFRKSQKHLKLQISDSHELFISNTTWIKN
jgi:hypothetical protein